MLILLSRGIWIAAFLDLAFILYMIITGCPPELWGYSFHLKNIKKPFLIFILLVLAALLVHPRRKEKLWAARERIRSFVEKPVAIWILFAVYAVLFTWQQLTVYLSVNLHFIPFGFYDYMLYYFFQGKITYTGLLHGYYHANFILLLLAPVWWIFKSPLVLILSYGPLAALAIFPLYFFAKEKFKEPLAPFLIAFLYLNYRYLHNVLMIDFSIEIFYPLFLFTAFYLALKQRWALYYGCVLLGLLIKEDSFLYFGALGIWVFFQKGKRLQGVLTGLLAVGYFVVLTRWILPLIESDILSASLRNYAGLGNSPFEIIIGVLKKPFSIFGVLLGDSEKWNTFFNLVYRLGFLPLFSPSVLLVFAPLFPLFFRSVARNQDFIRLHFHYAAAVLPFIFIALVSGFFNLYRRIGEKYREFFLWGMALILILANGGQYRTFKIKAENLESIRWARSLPAGVNVVTQGHLLPYIGYRQYNYYIALPWENPHHPYHYFYENADYYLIDFAVDPYPMDEAFLKKKVTELQNRSGYRIAQQDGKRVLFEKIKTERV